MKNTFEVHQQRLKWIRGLVEKYPELIPDIVYHGSFPQLNSDYSLKKKLTIKDGKEFFKVLRHPPIFTIRFREIDTNLIGIGWSVVNPEDIFNKKIGRWNSLENLLQLFDGYNKPECIIELITYDAIEGIPTKLYANLAYYIKKFINQSNYPNPKKLQFLIKPDKRFSNNVFLKFSNSFEDIDNLY